MHTRLTLRPGQKGTKKLMAQSGDRLVCVRHRYDEERKKRYKTVELMVEETEWEPAASTPSGDAIVEIQVKWGEAEVGRRVRQAGEKWNASKRVWELRYERVRELGLEGRIVGGGGGVCKNVDS